MEQFELEDGGTLCVREGPLKNKPLRVYRKGERLTGAPMRWGTFEQVKLQHREKVRRGQAEKTLGEALAIEAGLVGEGDVK
jgi:hypothetical protein